MRVVMITVATCVVVDDDRGQTPQAAACRKPLNDLFERMHREMQHGRGTVERRAADGAKVA